jgi:hypothetical protein
MPKLPDMRDYSYGLINGEIDWCDRGRENYHVLLAAAWEARARLAVEMLKFASHFGSRPVASRAQEALAIIGNLPPLSPTEPAP